MDSKRSGNLALYATVKYKINKCSYAHNNNSMKTSAYAGMILGKTVKKIVEKQQKMKKDMKMKGNGGMKIIA